MRRISTSFVREALSDQRGQVLPWVALGMVLFLGMSGLTVDLGRAYILRSQLQASSNAAALAAAGEVYNTSSTDNASTIASSYSSGAKGNENYNSGLGTVNTTVTTPCLNLLMSNGLKCPTSGTIVPNAVKVTQTGTLNTYFMRIFGIKTLTVSATALASMQGSPQPWNVAIILDATSSMGDKPPSSGSCSSYSTEFACALAGVQELLGHINSCAGAASCSASTAKFRVALFSFPNVSTSNVADDYTCGGTPTDEPYTFPNTNLTTYTPLKYGSATATYEDTPVSTDDGDANGFVYDYWSGSASNYLNSSSDLAKAITGCMKNPGGESTYYAGVIYAAQAALAAEQSTYTNSKNAIIILSDGQANVTSSSKFASGAVTPSADGYAGSAMTSTGHYPSSKDQCQQAIMAAQTAQTAGTTVYSVAFGSETTTGCGLSGGTDTSLIATATSGNPALTLASLTPCITMKNMASPSITVGANTTSYFYADTTSSSNGCTDNAHTATSISTIFDAIAATFTTPRLLPNNAS
jgi:Flp pilus assembly protein TadG